MSLLGRLGRAVPEEWKHNLKCRWRVPSMRWGLERLASSGFRPQTIIDVGAYKTSWSLLAKKVFPEAAILLVEPQLAMQKRLEAFCSTYPDCSYTCIPVTGDATPVCFLTSESNSRALFDDEVVAEGDMREIASQTLSQLVENTKYARPELLKIDVQGRDLEVLRGAQALVPHLQMIVLEVNFQRINPHVPVFAEVVHELGLLGFQPYDILELNYRPGDLTPWQADVFFARKESPFFQRNIWEERVR